MENTLQTFNPIHRPCPLCGSDQGQFVASIAHDLCGVGRVSFGFKACTECGMVYQSPLTHPDAIDAQYKAFSNYTFSAPVNPPLSEPGKRIMAGLASAGVKPGAVFDVGTATGALLYHFREAGWSVSGCDPSPKAAEAGHSHYGINIEVGGETECLPRQSDFDLIVFSHVLEHLPDPVGALTRANSALRRGGHVAFEFPCFVGPDSLPPGFLMMEHFNYFSETTTNRLLALSGFEPVYVKVSFWGRLYPVITVVAKTTEQPDTNLLNTNDFEHVSKSAEEYIRRENELWEKIGERLAAQLNQGDGAVIWGAGLHTSILLERTDILELADVHAILDRDTQKHGHSLRGVQVVSPDTLSSYAEDKIVISSYASEDQIYDALISMGIDSGRIVKLYNEA